VKIKWGRPAPEPTLAAHLHANASAPERGPRIVPASTWGEAPDRAELFEEATRVNDGIVTWLSVTEPGAV